MNETLKKAAPEMVKAAMMLLAAKQAGPEALAGFLSGTRQGEDRLWQRNQVDQETARRNEYQDAQIGQMQANQRNIDADNARQQEQLGLQRLNYAQGALSDYANAQAETATDPAQAENAVLQRSQSIAGAYGMAPDALSAFVPPMGPAISVRKKKRASDLYAAMEKRYGPEVMANDAITIAGGEEFGQVKPSQLRAMFEAQATDAVGAPAMPAVATKKPAAPGSFEEYVDAPPERQAQIESARKKYMQADDKPAAQPVTRYQQADILNDKGVPVKALFDAVSGRYIDPDTKQAIPAARRVPSAQEAMDSRKFQKADPVLRSIEELSERININQGLYAKMAGGAAKVAAKANLDDDVAEYQALIAGFTPLVARSLGHIGILTQQDVDSVKELFPKPGDSKSLRDRKIARIKSIISDLQGVEGKPAEAPAAAPAAPAGVPSYQEYLQRKQGAAR